MKWERGRILPYRQYFLGVFNLKSPLFRCFVPSWELTVPVSFLMWAESNWRMDWCVVPIPKPFKYSVFLNLIHVLENLFCMEGYWQKVYCKWFLFSCEGEQVHLGATYLGTSTANAMTAWELKRPTPLVGFKRNILGWQKPTGTSDKLGVQVFRRGCSRAYFSLSRGFG